MEKAICHDCGVEEGDLHNLGCDMERCPFCGNQLIACSCRYTMLGYKYDWNAEFCGLPESIYHKGLPENEENAWNGLLEGVRIPWIQYPNVCAKCGKLWPKMFSVSDEEWKHYIEKGERGQIICLDCYSYIKECIDSNK